MDHMDLPSGSTSSGDIPETLCLRYKRRTPGAITPVKSGPNGAGYIIFSPTHTSIPPGSSRIVMSDLSFHIPDGYYGRLAPLFDYSWSQFIDVGAGVVDSDYRGNVGVILFNHGPATFNINRGDRLAILILQSISHPTTTELSDNEVFPELNSLPEDKSEVQSNLS